MLGETIAVLRFESTKKDPMGDPIKTWTHETISNCLVRPIRQTFEDDGSDRIRQEHTKVVYTIAIPKTYTGKSLKGCKIALIDRGQDAKDVATAYDVMGEPDITKPCPTKWNMLVEVGRNNG